ncbi:SlyX family protein [Pseudomonadota bacterium]
METQIQSRLDELESRLAFQDDMIETLNETITRQDRDLVRMELRLQALADKLKDLAESSAMPGASAAHEVPPHY